MICDDAECQCGHPLKLHALNGCASYGCACALMHYEGPAVQPIAPPTGAVGQEEFATAAVRDTREGKGRYDLISPLFLARLAKHLEGGAKKYAARNWERGIPVSRSFDSMVRHAMQYLEGQRDEDHLAAVACNIMFIIHTLEMVERGVLPSELSDFPNYVKLPK